VEIRGYKIAAETGRGGDVVGTRKGKKEGVIRESEAEATGIDERYAGGSNSNPTTLIVRRAGAAVA